MKDCMQVECNNIGRPMKCLVTINGKDEVQTVWLCRHHVTEVQMQRGISN